jgi:hypothetical protein
MKRFLFLSGALLALSAFALEAGAIGVGQPGFHGAIDVSGYAHVQLVEREPVVIRPVTVGALARALYVYVPAAQQRNWARYCRVYDACGRPVYFVTKAWYEKVFLPNFQEEQRRRAIVRNKAGSRKGAEF